MTTDPVTIVIRERLRFEGLGPDEEDEICEACTYDNPARRKLEQIVRGANGKKRHALGFALKNEPPSISTWSRVGTEFSVPRGALSKVRAVLLKHGRTWRYDDQRVAGDPRMARLMAGLVHRPEPDADDGGALRWYQEEAVEACIGKQNCLLRAPTGSGKTSTLIGIIARLALPTLIVVDSAELMRQWRTRLEWELGLHEVFDVGQIGDGRMAVAPITIGMRQSLLSRVDDLRDTFGLVVVDEVHRAAAATFMGVSSALASRYRIGASADETRKDGKQFLVYDVFGEVAHEVTRDELIADGAVLDVECRVIPTEFRADWYVKERVETGSPDFNRLLDEMTMDAGRNLLALDIAHEEVATGEQVLVLTQRLAHARGLAETLLHRVGSCGLMLGGEDCKEAREKAVDDLRAGTLRVGVGMIQVMGTAIDLPSVGRGILATPIGANRQLYGQIRGRLCRPQEGKTAIIYVLWDQHVSVSAPLKRMLEWNRRVLVRDGDGQWVEGRKYLRRWKEQHHGT